MIKSRGFTLLELMIVVAVIAILAAIAVPSYFSQVRKSRRSDVEGALQSAALLEERVRADCPCYANAWATTPTCNAVVCPAGTTMVANPYTSSYYTITFPAVADSTKMYQFKAVAVGSQANDKAFGTSCATLFYDFGVTSAGQVTKTPAECWAK